MLAFPEAIHIPSVQATDFPALSQMLTQPNTASSVEYAMKHLHAVRLDRQVECHAFICCHLQRDQRCGYCGPLVAFSFYIFSSKNTLPRISNSWLMHLRRRQPS